MSAYLREEKRQAVSIVELSDEVPSTGEKTKSVPSA